MVLHMISAGQLHQLWRVLPIGSLDDVIGGPDHAWSSRRIPMMKASDAAV
jgi:hypothetical protein